MHQNHTRKEEKQVSPIWHFTDTCNVEAFYSINNFLFRCYFFPFMYDVDCVYVSSSEFTSPHHHNIDYVYA